MGSFVRAVWTIIAVLLLLPATRMGAQVFTVGERTATADMKTPFTPTHVDLPSDPMRERGRRELLRNLEAEQGFAHRVLPLGGVITLVANGNVTPGPEAYKQIVYKKGQAAAAGDRVAITAISVKGDRIDVDLNGGPYVKHRFLRHIQVGVGPAVTQNPDLSEQATGCRIELKFEGEVPDVSAPEVKALLAPLIDFGAKTTEVAYADTLPAPVKEVIEAHEVTVGMDRRMVLASLGQPESKIRETTESGEKYEDWIYGHQPQTVKFVRFVGDRVSLVKVAAVGKPVELHTEQTLAGALPPAPERTVAVGDGSPTGEKQPPPSLLKPGETQVVDSSGSLRKVEIPDETKPATPAPKEFRVTPVGQ
jgi:hypothetical protein